MQFIDTANAPIFGIDAQGNVNEWNQQSEKITGFTKSEVMGKDLVANFINDDYKVGCQGIEFWTTIAEVEYSRLEKGTAVCNYITTVKEFLVPLLLNAIKTTDEE